MKRYLAVAALFALCVSAQADIIYRCRFRPDVAGTIACYAGMTINGFSIVANGVNTYTMNNSAILEVGTTGSEQCCENPEKRHIGYTWEEWSSDAGIHWNLVSPTFVSVFIGIRCTDEMYTVSGNGTLTTGSETAWCPQF